MSGLLSDVVLKRIGGGEAKGADALAWKLVGLYFSAHWCPPCRSFTSKLTDFYYHLNGEFEVVMVPCDSTKEEVDEHLKQCPPEWFYLPYGDEYLDVLERKYDVDAVPTLVVVMSDGTVITKMGREDVLQLSPMNALHYWLSAVM